MSLEIFRGDPCDPYPRKVASRRSEQTDPPRRFTSTEEFIAWDMTEGIDFNGESDAQEPLSAEEIQKIIGYEFW